MPLGHSAGRCALLAPHIDDESEPSSDGCSSEPLGFESKHTNKRTRMDVKSFDVHASAHVGLFESDRDSEAFLARLVFLSS